MTSGTANLVFQMLEARIAPVIRRHPRLCLAALSLALGTLYVAFVVGARVIDPRDISLLGPDGITEYLGWTFMRQDPVTALPLTFTDRVGYPLIISTTYFDLIPALAIGLLPFSRILPSEFQYFGCFRCLCAGALFYLGHQISRLYGRSELLALSAGTLFMTNSVFTFRMGLHNGLAPQFFLVWVIYEAMKRLAPRDAAVNATRVRGGMWLLSVLAVVAIGVNPYIALMCMILTAGYFVAAAALDRKLLRTTLLLVPLCAAASACAAWFFGYYSRSADVAGPGLGVYSANLNTLVNPVMFSRFLRAAPLVGREQMEGAAYLGVAVEAALLIAVVAAIRSSAWRSRMRPLVPVFCAAGLAFGLSLSQRVTLGPRLLFEVAFPEPIQSVLSAFRGTGRLTWPLFYTLLAVVVATIGIVVPPRAQGICSAAFAIVQLIELTPMTTGIRPMLALNPYIEPTSEAFRRLGEAHQHLVVLPAWQCDKQRTPGGAMGYATFGLVAARQHMTINSYYSGRYNMRAIEFHCRIVPAELVRRGPDANTAYVLDSTFLPWFEAQGRKTHECGVRDDFRLCVRRGTLH